MTVVVHYPESGEGMAELARQVADLHAEEVLRRIGKLECPLEQKRQLLEAISPDKAIPE